MTRDKAIEEVKNYENYPNGLSKECRDYIIKALEQEPILDKIRAEISALKSHHINDCYDDGFQGCRTNVLHILDKYKEESEG